ncbi:hypothetical protein GIB67_000373, partial [Kingdonia uniflora]
CPSHSNELHSRSNERFHTPWNFGPRVNLVRTSLDVVRTGCYVSRVGDQLSQSCLNELGVVRTSFADARV